MSTINSIIIVGGGSSGWITAAYLSNNLPKDIKITLIESSKIPTIGVGEGTQPYTMPFLEECGMKPEDWMEKTDSTYKYGVELVGWSKDPIFIDNDTQEVSVLGPEIMFHNYWLSTKPSVKEYFNSLPSYVLAKHNKSPKANHSGLDYTPGFVVPTWDAVHFDANALGETLKHKCIDRITHIDDLITNVILDENGVVELVLEDKGTISADVYIDCSGFDSILLEGALGVKFNSIENILLCNRAVAIPKPYTNKYKEMHPYTKSIVMPAGWRWVIPTYSKIGNGYVYSDKFISPEEAEKTLREEIDEWDSPANHIQMKTGVHDYIAYKNVYAVGLSAAFAEPLEATGITFSTKAIQNFVFALNDSKGHWNDNVRNFLTNEYHSMVDEIISFIFLHYYFAEKNDTPFWKEVHNLPVPGLTQEIIDMFIPHPPNKLMVSGYFSMFHVGQWFSLLYGHGVYDKYSYNINEDILKYGNWVNETNKNRTKCALDIFPNQYNYLQSIYNKQ